MLPKLTSPMFNITIPSTGNSVKIRPMLVKEEKILLVAKQSEDQTDILTAMKQVVNNCLIDLDSDTLTLFDLEYVFLRIRGVSISNVLKMSYKDSEDDKVYDFTIDLDKDVTIKTDQVKPSTIEFTNEENKFAITLKYPPATLYDDKGFLQLDSDHVFEGLMFKCLDKITMNDIPLEVESEDDFKQWLDQLSVEVYTQAGDYFKNLPTLYCELKYTNTNNNERKIVLTSLQDFFSFR